MFLGRSSTRVSSPTFNDFDDRRRLEGRESYFAENQRNQDLVLTLTQEIKKSVNDSMQSIVTGLRNEVTELRSELQAMKDHGSSASCASKRGRLPKVLLVSYST